MIIKSGIIIHLYIYDSMLLPEKKKRIKIIIARDYIIYRKRSNEVAYLKTIRRSIHINNASLIIFN